MGLALCGRALLWFVRPIRKRRSEFSIGSAAELFHAMQGAGLPFRYSMLAPEPFRTAGWQPIETAPKSGAKIDLWAIYSRGHFDKAEVREGERITDAFWKEWVGWVETIKDGDYSGETREIEWHIKFQKAGAPTGEWNKQVATHWRDLPEPPEDVHV